MTTGKKRPEADLAEIREKRVKVLRGVWGLLVQKKYIDNTRFTLSNSLVDEVITHYSDDLGITKIRYNIEGEAQLHKVAGLMAASILRYRPIVPMQDFSDPKDVYANEDFAILHGLAVCGEHEPKVASIIQSEAWFKIWWSDFRYLLHRRNYTAESLSMIFETLCLFRFPDNFKVPEEARKKGIPQN